MYGMIVCSGLFSRNMLTFTDIQWRFKVVQLTAWILTALEPGRMCYSLEYKRISASNLNGRRKRAPMVLIPLSMRYIC